MNNIAPPPSRLSLLFSHRYWVFHHGKAHGLSSVVYSCEQENEALDVAHYSDSGSTVFDRMSGRYVEFTSAPVLSTSDKEKPKMLLYLSPEGECIEQSLRRRYRQKQRKEDGQLVLKRMRDVQEELATNPALSTPDALASLEKLMRALDVTKSHEKNDDISEP